LGLLEFRKGTRPNYWLSSLQLLDSNKRDGLIDYMKSKQIEVRPVWDLIHKQKPYIDCRVYGSRNAEKYVGSVVNIPSSTNLTIDNLKRITKTIGRFIYDYKLL
jgi:perosamine synthetase